MRTVFLSATICWLDNNKQAKLMRCVSRVSFRSTKFGPSKLLPRTNFERKNVFPETVFSEAVFPETVFPETNLLTS